MIITNSNKIIVKINSNGNRRTTVQQLYLAADDERLSKSAQNISIDKKKAIELERVW